MVGLASPFERAPTPSELNRMRTETVDRIGTFGTGGLGVSGSTAGMNQLAPVPQATAPRAQLLFNPVTKEMAAGGRRFGQDDLQSVLSVPQFVEQPLGPDPEGPDWVRLTPEDYQGYVRSLSERRGKGELLGLGARQVAEGTIGGVGTLMEYAGATEAGPAVRGFATGMFGQDENEQIRSALIAENSTLMEKIIDGTFQAAPTLASVLVGGGVAGLGARALGAGARGIGAAATAGGAGSSFPMHISSYYEAATRNGFDPNDPEVKTQIIAGALANTALDTFGVTSAAGKIVSRALLQTTEEAAQKVARGALRNALVGGAKTGFAEAITETLQTVGETALFDPTVREQFGAQDWKALAPYLANTYGEDYLVAAGIGAFLGGGVGAIANARATPGTPIPTDEPVDLTAQTTDTGPDLYGQQSFQPLALPYDPNARTVGAIPLPGESMDLPERAEGPLTRPLTLQQTGIMRGTTGGLRPEDRQSGNITVPSGERNITLEGEVIPPEAAAAAPQAARLRALGAPPATEQLPPPVMGAADFTAGPEGVSPAGAQPVTPGEQLRVGAAPRAAALPAPPQTAMADRLRAAMTARQQEQAAAQAATAAQTEAQRAEQMAAQQRGAEVDEAYAQREAQRATMYTAEQQAAYDQLTTEQKAYVDADATWEQFRPQDGKKQSGVTLRDLTRKAQQDWVTAVQQGTANQALYEQLRNRRQVGKSAPLMDVPTILQTQPEPEPTPPTTTPPTGGKARKLKTPTPKAAAPKAAVVRKGPAAQPKPRAEAAPVETPKAAPRPQLTGARTMTGEESAARAALTDAMMDEITTGTATPRVSQEAVAAKREAEKTAPTAAASRAVVTRDEAVKRTGREVGAIPPKPSRAAARAEKAAELEAMRAAIEEDINDLELDMKPSSAPMEGEKLGAALELMEIRDNPDTPTDLRDRAQQVLEANSKTKGEAALSIAESVYTASKLSDMTGANTATVRLSNMIEEFNAAPAPVTNSWQAEFRRLASQVRKEDPDARLGDRPLLSYVKSNNDPAYARVDGGVQQIVSGQAPDAATATVSYTPEGATEPVDLELVRNATTGAWEAAPGQTLPAGFSFVGDTLTIDNGTLEEGSDVTVTTADAAGNAADPVTLTGGVLSTPADPTITQVDGDVVIGLGGGRTMLSTWNTIDGVVDLDGRPVTPIAPGRVQLLVRNFATKLARAPKITVVRNQAELKSKNPKLYAQAVAARPQGDFDAAPAMGYSFGDGQVIIFTDRIGTEQQLNFVLAHETLGHFGLRGIMPADKFNAVMGKVYKSNPILAARVDQAVDVRGISREEATEEYLADYAAVMDMSLLTRVAAAMKDALNKLGFKFSDDMVRHLLRTARRYVRNGKRDNLFSVESMFADITTDESGTQSETGRFREAFVRDNLNTDQLTYDVFGMPRSAQDIADAIKPTIGKLSDTTENFLNKFFSLTGFRALENAGLEQQVKVLTNGAAKSTEIRNRAEDYMRDALNRVVSVLGVRVMGGITEQEQLAASRLSYGQQDSVRGTVEAKVDRIVKQLRDNNISPRMFSVSGDRVVPNTKAIDAYIAAGRMDLPQAKAMLAKDARFKKIAESLNKDHPTWKAYIAMRDTQAMVDVEFVKVQYEALLQDRRNAVDAAENLLTPAKEGEADPKLTTAEENMLKKAIDRYYEIYSGNAVTVEGNLVANEGSAKRAAEFVRKLNEAVIAKGFDTTKEDALREFFDGKLADDFIAKVVAFRKRVTVNDDNKFLLQRTITEIGGAELSYTSAEESIRQLLVQGYTPILRPEEQYQMRLSAYDPETNERVQMSEEYRGLAAYRVFGTADEATSIANSANAKFASTTLPDGETATDVKIITTKDGTKKRVYEVSGRTEDGDFKMRPVELRFEVSSTVSGMYAPLQLNLHEFLRGLRQYGLNIPPAQLEEIVIDMTAQDARARKRLEQTGNPGYEVQGGITALEAIARHADGRASLIAKIQMRPQIDRLMNTKLSESRKLWFGDEKRLQDLKAKYEALAADPRANKDALDLANREYIDYAAKMKNTITVVNGTKVNQGNKYLSDAYSIMAFVNGNRDLNETDWGSGPVVSWVRRWAAASQLGGTLTQPIMNNVGPYTNFIPWLGTFNSKTGFGGGAGIRNAYAQYIRAFSDVGGSGGVSFSKAALDMHTADYWDQVATGLVTHTGVTKAEAEFIANETRNGILTPAQANSVLGAARNYTTNPAIRQALDKWMFFYTSSEQATRRASALAAFRVEWSRQVDALGKTTDTLTDAEYKRILTRATDFANTGVRLTLGDYNALNRPAAWRSGLQSFLYMYKVWPTTTIQTLRRLDARGKALMLGPMLLAAGVAGLPFAEDIEDILDTILQRLGISAGSIRLEFARAIDEIMPGASPFILKGALSSLVGSDVAGRFGAGNFVPGTAGLLPGQELSQTVKEVFGPAWGFIEGSLIGGSQLVAAPLSDSATVVDAMRGGPATLLRALGDAVAYNSAGAVIDKRGYVISDELTTGMLISRVLGFTPTSVASQYEMIRLAKRETNYQKQVVARLRTALLKAEMSGDRVTAASIRRTVKEWNQTEKGTLLEIKNFEKNYQRLRKQAMMPANERFLQSVGKANRDAAEFVGDLVMYD